MYKTLVVVDDDPGGLEKLGPINGLEVISFLNYLREYPKRNEPKTRIINLCDTSNYLSKGYYCSLLAEARKHRVLPSVSTINILRDLAQQAETGLSINNALMGLDVSEKQLINVFFGGVEQPQYQKLARLVFDKYPAPILKLHLYPSDNGLKVKIKRSSFTKLSASEKTSFIKSLNDYTERVWRSPASQKRLRWDMAILVDPKEKHPPSDAAALKRFVKAAAKVGIHAELLTAADIGNQISQYDALFIRETTGINHHTYRLARKAEQEGLVVIDDPTSILRCCNKVFLHDAFTYKQVPSLKTRFATGATEDELDELESGFDYPIVLKMPEGSFSIGVFKVADRDQLRSKLNELFQESALVLVQEFLYTDFDWRIGVLNGRAIYACRYHMARNHWQIYNHSNKRSQAGNSETLPTFEAPKVVLDAALKACSIIGKGLYGVDIKQKGNQAYVIEVNDNPSIDHSVEDDYLGDELYMQIMAEFVQRMEQRGR